MSVRRVVGYYDSRRRWLAGDPLPELNRTAVEELAFLIPREEEVIHTFEEMAAVLEPRGVVCTLIEGGDLRNDTDYEALAHPDTICWNMTDGFSPSVRPTFLRSAPCMVGDTSEILPHCNWPYKTNIFSTRCAG